LHYFEFILFINNTKLDKKIENNLKMCVKTSKKVLFLKIIYDKMKKVIQLEKF